MCNVVTARHANTTESKSRLDRNRGRALHAHVSPLATYNRGRSGRDTAVSPSTAICSERSTAESSASNSLGQGDPESSASSSLGQSDPESSASSSLGEGHPEHSASSSLGQGHPERSKRPRKLSFQFARSRRSRKLSFQLARSRRTAYRRCSRNR